MQSFTENRIPRSSKFVVQRFGGDGIVAKQQCYNLRRTGESLSLTLKPISLQNIIIFAAMNGIGKLRIKQLKMSVKQL